MATSAVELGASVLTELVDDVGCDVIDAAVDEVEAAVVDVVEVADAAELLAETVC